MWPTLYPWPILLKCSTTESPAKIRRMLQQQVLIEKPYRQETSITWMMRKTIACIEKRLRFVNLFFRLGCFRRHFTSGTRLALLACLSTNGSPSHSGRAFPCHPWFTQFNRKPTHVCRSCQNPTLSQRLSTTSQFSARNKKRFTKQAGKNNKAYWRTPWPQFWSSYSPSPSSTTWALPRN